VAEPGEVDVGGVGERPEVAVGVESPEAELDRVDAGRSKTMHVATD